MGSAGSGGAGQGLAMLLLLLGVLGAAGYWNYQRNLALESLEVRPYASLGTGDLEKLLLATEAEVAALESAYAEASARPAPAGDGGSRWSGFEATQRHGRAVRELGARISGHEGSIAELRREIARREDAGDELDAVLRRVFSF